jgi:UDP-GlcNAc:undecaprenyl-phosphate GlcNAc-1-phosphate transferase
MGMPGCQPPPGERQLIFENILFVFASFLVSLILVALVLRLSHIKSWYDKIDERKIHTGDVPRLGGVGFSLTFIIVAVVITFRAGAEDDYGLRFLPVIAAMLIVLCLGVFDDFYSLSPRKKLVVQIIAALLVVIPDYTFRRLFFFNIGGFGVMAWWLRCPITLLWIVGMTNALNFIDGLDGLSGGMAALIALTYGVIFPPFSSGHPVSLLCFCLAAALAGFLVFNLPLPRARIFMGDGGALFLGFILAVLPLVNRGNGIPALPLPYAAALLLIPILDVISAVWRRIRDGRSIDSPDRNHIHHKLMLLGLKTAGVDCLLWSLQIVLCVLVYTAIKTPGRRSLLILGAAYVLGLVFFGVIHVLNRRLVGVDTDQWPGRP